MVDADREPEWVGKARTARRMTVAGMFAFAVALQEGRRLHPNPDDYAGWLREVPISERQARKYLAIAESEGLRAAETSCLPESVDALAILAQLPPEAVSAGVSSGRLNPAMRPPEARQLLLDEQRPPPADISEFPDELKSVLEPTSFVHERPRDVKKLGKIVAEDPERARRLAEKIRDGEADTVLGAQRALEAEDEDLRDPLGTPVPAHLRAIFLAIPDAVAAVSTQVSALLRAMQRAEDRILETGASRARIGGSRSVYMATKREPLKTHVELCKLYSTIVVHRECAGSGCDGCDGAGWLPMAYHRQREKVARNQV